MISGKMQAWGLTVLRVVVGIVFLMHGYQKFFKFGFRGVAGMLTHLGIPLPAFFAIVLMLVEFVGGILLITGLATRAEQSRWSGIDSHAGVLPLRWQSLR